MFIWWSVAALISVVLVLLSPRIHTSWIEALGMITAIVCVWDAANNRARSWPIGAISCVAFFIIFANAKLYGNMALQVIYLGQAVWGDYVWRFGGESRGILRINGLPSLNKVQLVGLFALVTLVCTGVLTAFSGTAPFWDTFTTVLSIVANQLLIRRRVENWYLWIVVDMVSVALFASQGLVLTTATYILYLVITFSRAVPLWRKEAHA